MESFSIVLALIALATTAKILYQRRRRRHRNLPPGPKPWPIIGNMNLIDGSAPHKSLHSLSQTYGGIMQMKFGNIPVVIVSSPDMAKQFFKLHDANFASRPELASGKYTAYNYSDMLWAPYGASWRQARKIYLTEVFSEKRLDYFQPIRAEESRAFHSRLASLAGEPVELREHLSLYTLSTMCRIVLGDKCFSEMMEQENPTFKLEELQGMMHEWMLLNSAINVGDWIPLLRFLDVQGYVKRMKDLYKKFDRFHSYVIDDHVARRPAGEKDEIAPREDVVDTLLKLAEDPILEVKLTRDGIKGLIQDLIVGGSDTTAAVVEWAILEVMRHPRVAEKAKEELDRVIGRNRWVKESDFPQLPYINAIIMETMRVHPLNMLLPPHYAMDDCKVSGYDIAKGTVVILNAYSLGRDPNSWDSPEEFLPERFMGKEIDVTGGGNFALLPFGSGRRSCPGYKHGLKTVGTMLPNLLHGFDLKLVEGMRPQDISVDDVYGLIQYPKHPLPIIVEPTLPPHLY